MNSLILSLEKGDPIEKIYYTAMVIADTAKANELFAAWQPTDGKDYWYDTFRRCCGRDNVLISAVINVCSVPFGAYVLEKWDESTIVLTPWMLSAKFDKDRILGQVFSDQVTSTDLDNLQHTFLLTADFLRWLEKREVQIAAHTDAALAAKPLRIAMIGHKRIPSREGGIEVVVTELASHMTKLGLQVDAYNRWDLFTEGGKTGGKEWSGVRVHQIPTLHSSSLNALIYSILAAVRACFTPYDVYHFHAIGPCAMLWLPHMLGKRTVATIHGLDWQRAKWGRLASAYLKLGEKIAARYADEIIVLSESNREYFRQQYNRTTSLIPNGMERQPVGSDSLINAKYGISRNEFILFVARIVPEKGLHYLLEAFRHVRTSKKLIICGGLDPESPYCEQIINAAAQDDRVLLAGFVQGRELEELYGNCCLYVLPSDVEGMPLSLLEAISHGAPCLVSDIPENLEASKGCVPTFKHGDPENLRLKLQQLIDHEVRQIPLESCWDNWDTVTEKTIELYREVISRTSVHRGK